MKKLIAIILTVTLAVSLNGCITDAPPTEPAAKSTSKEDVLMEIARIYVETELKLAVDSCVLGNQLSAYCLSAGELVSFAYEKYPVFAEDKIVAFATCFLSDKGEYLTNCGVQYAEAFWIEYSKQPAVPVAIVLAQDGVYLVRDGECPVLLHNMPLADYDSIQELENCRSSLTYSIP